MKRIVTAISPQMIRYCLDNDIPVYTYIEDINTYELFVEPDGLFHLTLRFDAVRYVFDYYGSDLKRITNP